MDRFKLFLLVGFCGGLLSCAMASKPLEIPFDPYQPVVLQKKSVDSQREVLTEFFSESPADQVLLQDIEYIFDGMFFDGKGDLNAAVNAWRKALPTAEGPFGEIAVKGWIRAYCKQAAKKIDRAILAKLILAESREGTLSPWMVSKGLVTDQALAPLLSEWVPNWLAGDPSAEGGMIDAPPRQGIPAGDPVLIKLAAEVCKYKARYSPDWSTWRSGMSPQILVYFDGIVAQCSGKHDLAIAHLMQASAALSSSDATASIALEAYDRVIKMRRDQGEREAVAPLFLPLMKLWKNASVSEATLGMSREAFVLRKMEDALSAARHRALINDVENAKIFAQETIRIAQLAGSESWAQSNEAQTQLSSTLAEAHHLLGFRLATESRDWEQAISVTNLALQIPHLTDEWKNRLKWSAGLYEYLAGNYESSRKQWEQMLADQTDDSYRPMLLYWIAESHAKLGNSNEADFYLKTLREDHPISFYSVAASSFIDKKLEGAWQSTFGGIAELRPSISRWAQQDLGALRTDERRSRLLRRAEVLVANHIDHFSTMALDEMQKTLDLHSFSERDVTWGLYLTRLYGASGDWLGSIGLTTKLAKAPQFWEHHPEQLLAYFPRPWETSFLNSAKDASVPEAQLQAIARQESSFRVDAKSAASAYGLMQLTAPTAKRLQASSGINLGALPSGLYAPEPNIALGARYLNELSARFQGNLPYIYASYNAGEQTVETWRTRREFENPLVFIELIPYSETRSYVKNVMRNEKIYQFLNAGRTGK